MCTDFKRGDPRRILFVLATVEVLERPTLTTLVEETGYPKASVNDMLNKILNGQIPGIKLIKNGPVYSIQSWGKLINKKGAKEFFYDCKVG